MSTKDDNGGRWPNAPPEDTSPRVSHVDGVSGYEKTWTELLNAGADDAMIAKITIPLPVLLALLLQVTPAQGRAIAVLLVGERWEWFHNAFPVAVAVPAPSVQEKLESMSEAEARAVLRELREEHPEWFA